jgi:DNA-binding NarL/FixJ family response regulator
MDDIVNSAERVDRSMQLPALVLIEPLTLTRTCILNILKRELLGFDIIDIATTDDLNCTSGHDIRLVALGIGDKPVADSSVEDDLALLIDYCSGASVALLSNRDDEATALAAMHRGVRGFFPSSLPVEVVVAGLRLVLAGGVYRPLPIIGLTGTGGVEQSCPRVLPSTGVVNGAEKRSTENNVTDFTPREQQVLGELELGLPNKVIAAKLNLSENTVKMHVQHIMRKCAARNRTQAVLRWSGRLANHGPDTDAPATSPS